MRHGRGRFSEAATTGFYIDTVGQAYPTSSHYGFQGMVASGLAALAAAQTGAGNVTLLNVVRQVQTDSFQLKTDNLHFDVAGQQALGTAFAEKLINLIIRKGTLMQVK